MKKILINISNKKANAKEERTLYIIILFIISYLFLLSKILTDNINNLDTMWTYRFCQRIYKGYIPYKDYNMVITPLFAQTTGIIFKVFNTDKIFIFNIIGAIYTSAIVVVEYLIFRKLKMSNKLSMLCIFLTIIYPSFFATNSYNILALLLLLITYYIEIEKIRYEKYIKIKQIDEKKKNVFGVEIKYSVLYNVISGFVLGLLFLSKQNIGIYTILGITLYYFIKELYVDKRFKKSFIQLSIKAIFCILPILIECIYLYLNGALYNFIDYCFLGIGTFNKLIRASLFNAFFGPKDFYQLIINSIIIAFILICPIIFILKLKNKIVIRNRIDLNIVLLSFIFCIIGIMYSVPLANAYHMYVTKYICLIIIFANIFMINRIKMYVENSISKFSYIITIVIPIVCALSTLFIYAAFINKSKVGAFEYSYFPYMEENNVLSVAYYAITYEATNNIPLIMTMSNSSVFNVIRDKNGGIFELPLHGNMGHDDYNKAINELKKYEEELDEFAVMIFTNDKDMFWQDAKEIPQYIRKNYIKVDEFSIFSIYLFHKQ